MKIVQREQKTKLYSSEEVEDIVFNTPKKKRHFEEFYKKYNKQLESEAKAEIGQEIRQARKKKGLTQEEFAKRLKTSRPAVSRIEKGKQNLTVGYLTKISYALEKPIEIKIHD